MTDPAKKEMEVLKGLSGEKRIDLKLKVSFDTIKKLFKKGVKGWLVK